MDEMNWELFFEIHRDMPRQGPGDRQSTERAFRLMRDLPDNSKILDIGCGPGKQTIDLIRITDGTITAVDNHSPFLDQLQIQVQREGLWDRIEIVKGDMTDLHFHDGSFDVIWSEGAIFIIGFELGLKSWKRLLTPRGYMAVTELTRLKPDPPEEAKTFWEGSYPAMQDAETNIRAIEEAGYLTVDHFTLPDEAWWEDYYNPLQDRIEMLKGRDRDNADMLEMLEAEEMEMDFFKKYCGFYGYVFYVMQNTGP
jgi:ubiquinone/menaquinone biosynthesis C-methylase UbiE